MDQAEFDKIKAGFPWTERVVSVNGIGGIVQVLDNAGYEVPLFTMTRFLEMITRKLTGKPEDVLKAKAEEPKEENKNGKQVS